MAGLFSVWCVSRAWAADGVLALRPKDVVVFVGGTDVVAAQETGHFETLLAVQFRGQGIRCRNMGWEGDTVFAQPRDLNFPPLPDQLRRAGATVVFTTFGQTEAFRGPKEVAAFVEAYEKLLDDFGGETKRLVLVIPPPFEAMSGAIPDLKLRNAELRLYATAIEEIAKRRGLRVVDLFSAFMARPERRTSNGLHLTPFGQALVAQETARQLGFAEVARQAGEFDQIGRWSNLSWESIRKEIVAKNRLWFDYWRPMNWAFLAGDRTDQLSSRDHRDPKVRWFPREMENFVPLIEQAEARIESMAKKLSFP